MRKELELALSSGSIEQIESQLPKFIPGLVLFVQVRFKATLQDAEDAAQSAILSLIEQLRVGEVPDAEKMMSYLRVSARRMYYRNAKRLSIFDSKEEITDDDLNDEELVSDHLDVMIDNERISALKKCIADLTEDARDFIEFVLRNATATAEMLSAKFSLSHTNVWTKKSRLIKQLSGCVQNKIA